MRVLFLTCLALLWAGMPQARAFDAFTFGLTSDVRNYSGPGIYDSQEYFRGAMQAMTAQGVVDFMISPGDMDPPDAALWTIQAVMGQDFPWVPVVGNHELPGNGFENASGANLEWLENYDYGSVAPGPSGCPVTTFSFDYANCHFAVLNQYCDTAGNSVTQGDVPDHLYDWLAADLENSTAEHLFVIGHEPAYPRPDADNGRLRHVGDSLDQYPSNRDRFWDLLREKGVLAYLCAHTHNFSAVKIRGVWQIDSGHARGLGDTGARSTFLTIEVDGPRVLCRAFRNDAGTGPYQKRHTLLLTPAAMPWRHLLLN